MAIPAELVLDRFLRVRDEVRDRVRDGRERRDRDGARPGRLRTRLLDGGMLWAAWLRAPRRVGAVLPSSAPLASAMAAQVPAGPGLIVELGGGTGSITAGLLAAGIPAAGLIVVERDPLLVRRLRQRFPDAQVLCGDACRLPELLAAQGIAGPVKAVVSSLPMLAMTPPQRARLMRGVGRVLQPGGTMVQYTYGIRCPVPERTLVRSRVQARRAARVWRNVPPAFVWRFESGEGFSARLERPATP
jgi:phosphatidylethanolamine/phosphatidyl-N-methylethanolamine N-methyltransferase